MHNNKWLEKHSWEDLRSYVIKIKPELTTIIDRLSPSHRYPLYLAKYPYGALIVNKGVFQVVNDAHCLVPLSHASISNKVKEDLGYNKMVPTGLISRNSIETFFAAKNYTIPISLYSVGDTLALWHVLEEAKTYQVGPVWSISSGARTIPKSLTKAAIIH